MKHKIIIAGAGGIGRAVGLLLANSDELNTQIFIGDLYLDAARESCNWVEHGTQQNSGCSSFRYA